MVNISNSDIFVSEARTAQGTKFLWYFCESDFANFAWRVI